VAVDARAAPAAAALCGLASRARAYVASTVLEFHAASGNVLNTFVVARPDGRLHRAGSAKRHPAHFERFVFASGAGVVGRDSRVLSLRFPFDADAASSFVVRVGVSICNDGYQLPCLTELAGHLPAIDLVLMPHSAPMPGATIGFSATESANMVSTLRGAAQAMSRLLRVPCVSTNHTGAWPKSERLPWPFGWMTGVQLRHAFFPGMACIAQPPAGSQPSVRRVGADSPGCVVAELTLRPAADSVADAASLPLPPSAAALLEATATGGGLALPALLQRSAPINEGAGRLSYDWYAKDRMRLASQVRS
jgi:hypothetical protein